MLANVTFSIKYSLIRSLYKKLSELNKRNKLEFEKTITIGQNVSAKKFISGFCNRYNILIQIKYQSGVRNVLSQMLANSCEIFPKNAESPIILGG